MYLLFNGDKYYPSGGWNDFRGDFASIELALEFLANDGDFDWWHIVDSQSMKVVRSHWDEKL